MTNHHQKPRNKKCKACGELFQPYNSMQKACSPGCAVALVEQAKEKKRKKEVKEFRENDKSKGKLTQEAQRAVNAYIRVRDKGRACISCEGFKQSGGFGGGDYDAGHWHGVGAHPEVRFKVWNIHRQCKSCNNYLSGHPIGYRAGLIRRFGRDWVETRERRAVEAKLPNYSKDDLRRIAKIFRKKKRLYEKLFR